MPEDSVRPKTQTLVIFIRRKGLVGGLNYLSKYSNILTNNTIDLFIKFIVRQAFLKC